MRISLLSGPGRYAAAGLTRALFSGWGSCLRVTSLSVNFHFRACGSMRPFPILPWVELALLAWPGSCLEAVFVSYCYCNHSVQWLIITNLLYFRRSQSPDGSHWAKITMLAGLVSSRGHKEEIHLIASSTFQRLPAFLVLCPCLSFITSSLTWTYLLHLFFTYVDPCDYIGLTCNPGYSSLLWICL